MRSRFFEKDTLFAQAKLPLSPLPLGVGDEFERARLTATGLPSLLPCRVSGAALLDEAEGHWSLVLQNDGEQLGSTHAEQVLAELEPLFHEALHRTTALIARTDRDTRDHRIPPSIETFGVRFLAVAPVMTLQHRMGVLLIGREGADAFSREEELTLSTLAEHLAIGIENLRLSQTLEKRSRELEEIAARYRSLYNNTPVMMHSIDSEGRLITVNDYWLQTLGYERSEVLGRRSIDFLTEASCRHALDGNVSPRLVRQLSSLVVPCPSRRTDSANAIRAGISCGWIADIGVARSSSRE